MPDWPHAPLHRLDVAGAYMVTGGTYHKERLVDSPAKLDLVCNTLFSVAAELDWQLQAWAILANHYHFVAISPENAATLRKLISKVHTLTARQLNGMDDTPGRRVWYQFWDSHLTYERSYLARLKYVHENPVHHGAAKAATLYRWCSAGWFERNATAAFQRTVAGFKVDRLRVKDDF